MKYPIVLKNKCKSCLGDIIAKRSRDLTKEFCGPGCVGIFFRTKEKEYIKCLTCSKEFEKTCKTKNMYCSTDCYHKSQIIIHLRNCERCNKEFKLKNIAYEKRGSGRFCSRECSAAVYSYNENYFNKIDTSQKAYWLGFIYADGCISDRRELILHLSNKDIKHLEIFKKHIKSNSPINNCQQNSISLTLRGKQIIRDLKNLGVIPRKTFIIKYPNIPEDLNRHFIRGVFDGDGCLYKKNEKVRNWSIYTASKKFKDSIINIIEKETGIKAYSYIQNNGYTIRINKKEDVKLIGNYIYSNANIYLKRKKEKFNLY